MFGLNDDFMFMLAAASALIGALVAVFVCRRVFALRIGELTRQLARSEAARQTSDNLLEQSRLQTIYLQEQLRRLQASAPRSSDVNVPTPSSWMELPEVVDHSALDFPDTQPSRAP